MDSNFKSKVKRNFIFMIISASSQCPDYKWLQHYRREDFSAINQSIAQGQSKLAERDIKFREELARRAPEYTVIKDYRVCIATWNVNEAPVDVDLFEWLAVGDTAPDIYAIAFQELDMSTRAITMSETRPDSNWTTKVMEALHTGGNYEHLTSIRLVGMMLIVAINRLTVNRGDLRFNKQSVGTGALNIMV